MEGQMSREPVTVVIYYRAQVGQEDLAKRELAGLVRTVVAQESGCLGIALCQDPSDLTRFLLYECWTERAIYLGPHMNTPHLQGFIQRARGFLVGPPEITFWREVAEARPSAPRAADHRAV
jgi:quinol monooxygenase YgiN